MVKMRRIKGFLLSLALILCLCGSSPQAGQIRRVYNLTLTDANTEYSQTLTGSVHQITAQARTAVDVKMGVDSGQSGTTYFTIKSGDAYYEQIVTDSALTLYFQSGTAGVVVEIIAWSSN